MRLPVLALALAAVTCDAESKEILIARGPLQLDSAGVRLALTPPFVPDHPTHLCLAFDKSRYTLLDILTWSVRPRRPEDTARLKPSFFRGMDSIRVHLGPDSSAIHVGAEVQTSTGELVRLHPGGYTGGLPIGPEVCLFPHLVQGTRYTMLRLWSSRPLVINQAAWDVAVH